MKLSAEVIKKGFQRIRNSAAAAYHDPHFWLYFFFFAAILVLFLINTVHESYPDEFDNILGGWNILHGNVLYKSFFTHHGPVAYILSAIIELFSGNSFVRFRLVYALFMFLYLGGLYFYFRNKFSFSNSRFYLLFLLFFGVGATYFWGHMLLADNISALFLVPAIGLLILNRLYEKKLAIKDAIFISLMAVFAVLSSLTYIYLVMVIYIFMFFEFVSSNNLSYRKLKNFLAPVLIIVLPYVIFLILLLVTGSFSDYIYQNFDFNQRYYIDNYPRQPGETGINPIRFAIVIAYNFLTSFSDLLIQVRDFNFNFPFNITLAVGNISFLIFVVLKKQFKIALLTILVLIYSNGRSNPLVSGERDYQSSVYIVFSLFVLSFVLYTLYDSLKNTEEFRKKVIFSALLLLTFIYSFYSFQFLGRKFMYKAYDKYMGNAPLIYDRPQIAPIINAVLTPDDYTWIGPFEFEELFYTKAKNASTYQIFNPGMGRSDRIQPELIEDFERTKPKLIWFDRRFFILGESPEIYGKPFIEYIDSKYTNIYDYREEGVRYVSVKPIDQRTDIETKLFMRRENVREIIAKLVELGIIRPSS